MQEHDDYHKSCEGDSCCDSKNIAVNKSSYVGYEVCESSEYLIVATEMDIPGMVLDALILENLFMC